MHHVDRSLRPTVGAVRTHTRPATTQRARLRRNRISFLLYWVLVPIRGPLATAKGPGQRLPRYALFSNPAPLDGGLAVFARNRGSDDMMQLAGSAKVWQPRRAEPAGSRCTSAPNSTLPVSLATCRESRGVEAVSTSPPKADSGFPRLALSFSLYLPLSLSVHIQPYTPDVITKRSHLPRPSRPSLLLGARRYATTAGGLCRRNEVPFVRVA